MNDLAKVRRSGARVSRLALVMVCQNESRLNLVKMFHLFGYGSAFCWHILEQAARS